MIRSEFTLEPAPFPSMCNLLSEVLIPDGKRFISSVDGNLAAAVLSPGGTLVKGKKRNKEADTYHFHVSLAHTH